MCPDTDWLVSEDRAGGRGKMRNHQRTNQKSVSQRVLRNHRRSNKAAKQQSNKATKQRRRRRNDATMTQRTRQRSSNSALTQSFTFCPTHALIPLLTLHSFLPNHPYLPTHTRIPNQSFHTASTHSNSRSHETTIDARAVQRNERFSSCTAGPSVVTGGHSHSLTHSLTAPSVPSLCSVCISINEITRLSMMLIEDLRCNVKSR